MKNLLRNLLFLSVLCFSISYDSYDFSEKYEKYKPHSNLDISICYSRSYIYKNDWEILGDLAFYSGIISTFALIVVWRRRKPIFDQKLSILPEDPDEKFKDLLHYAP